MTWIGAGFGALACIVVACVFLYMLVQNLRGLGSVPFWYHGIGLVAAVAGVFILGTISTNTMWEPIKHLASLTGPGLLVILIASGIFVLAKSSR